MAVEPHGLSRQRFRARKPAAHGGALLVPNHITWIDGILLHADQLAPIRMIAWAPNLENALDRAGSETVRRDSHRPAEAQKDRRGLPRSPRSLNNGELVCIFPEGGLTRTGQVQAFKPGLMKILEGTTRPGHSRLSGGPVGQHFQLQGGKVLLEMAGATSLSYVDPLRPADPASRRRPPSARPCSNWRGCQATEQSMQIMDLLTRSFIRQCKSPQAAAERSPTPRAPN